MSERNSSFSWASLVRYLLPLIWMGLIFVVSGTPSERIPKVGAWDTLVKKGSHMLAYGLLTVLWLRVTIERFSWRPAVSLTLLIVVLYAISDEYHQTFVPGRNGSSLDVLVDAVGALLGLWFWKTRARLGR